MTMLRNKASRVMGFVAFAFALALQAAAQDTASVKGVVTWKEGETAEKRTVVKMDAEPKCLQINGDKKIGTENSIINKETKGVANVILYVSGGLDESKTYEAPKDKILFDQKGCMYVPHVVSLQAGQTITVRNSDELLHNIHGLPTENPEFNFGQAKAGLTKDVELKKAEIFKVKCDVHPWMNAWIGVFTHPFHCVSNDKGEFEIKGLAPGNYEITAWHEVYGTFKQKVTVSTGETKELNFTLDRTNMK